MISDRGRVASCVDCGLTREAGANLAHGEGAEADELQGDAAALGRHVHAKQVDQFGRRGIRLLVALSRRPRVSLLTCVQHCRVCVWEFAADDEGIQSWR
jgi:hypothetical protein